MILGVTTLGMVLAVIAALSIACTSLSIRLGTDDGDPTAALVVVLGCNVAILVPIAAMYASAAPKLSLESALWFAAAGLTGTLLGRICYSRASPESAPVAPNRSKPPNPSTRRLSPCSSSASE